MAAIGWYGCEKEVETGCGLRVAGYRLRAVVSLVQVTEYLILYRKMKKSVAADNIIC